MINVKSLRDQNNEQSKNLNRDNQSIYTDMVCYLRVSALSEIQQEEISSDILRMFLDWQIRGQFIKDMIGEDYKQFVDDIIAAVKPHKSLWERIKEYLFIFIQAMCYMLTVDFIFIYLPKILSGNFSLVYDFSLSMALRDLLILVIAISIINYIGRNSFKLSKKKTPKHVHFIVWGCFVLFVALSAYLTKVLKGISLLSINIAFILAIIAIFWLYKIFRNIVLRKSTHQKNR